MLDGLGGWWKGLFVFFAGLCSCACVRLVPGCDDVLLLMLMLFGLEAVVKYTLNKCDCLRNLGFCITGCIITNGTYRLRVNLFSSVFTRPSLKKR